MSESRQDILQWLNDLLSLQLTKIEQLGNGAVHCQIMDSIYGDIPLAKVKFDANQEFQYISNFKILQSSFAQHGIEKVIPVERLVKMRFQENWEFVQWMKAFWDAHFIAGTAYDAVGRRKGKGGALMTSSNSLKKAGSLSTVTNKPAKSARTAASPNSTPTRVTLAPKQQSRTADTASDALIQELNKTVSELSVTVDSLEKERDFYFSKLREIELLLDGGNKEEAMVKEIQRILYSTEETNSASAAQVF